MPTLSCDKSDKPELIDKHNGIYRNQQRPQPYPSIQPDSGYGSTTSIRLDSVLTSATPSLLGLADRVKCTELLKNTSNFAKETAVECYESNFCSISTFCTAPGVRLIFKAPAYADV